MAKRDSSYYYDSYYKKYEYHLSRAEYYKRKKMAYSGDPTMYEKYAAKEYYHKMKAHQYKKMMKSHHSHHMYYETPEYES